MKDNDNISHKLLDYGIKAVLVAGAVYGITKIVKNYQKSNTEHQVEKNPEVSQAMTIYSAMNPSGMDWMKKMDGTNTEAILNTAQEITDLNKVQDAYRKLYNSSLLDDLRQELSPEDYTKFLNTLKFNPKNINKGSNKPKIDFKQGSLIATKLQANLRKTPKNMSKWSFDNNIIKLAEAGKFIGFATGKSEFDNSGAGETGTLFIEIQAVALDTKKPLFFWVAASQLQTISQADYKARKYPFFWLNEKDTLNGFDGTQKRVIAFTAVPVLDEQFRMVGIASPLQQLGYSIMELNDNKGNEYIKFVTNQKKQHWVNKKFVQVI
jgi:hypothetical protein